MIDDALLSKYIRKFTVLCVEDNEMTMRIYESIFEEVFGSVLSAKDGVEGLELFHAHRIDIIITDHQMPNMSGIEFIKAVREYDKVVPIVLVSGIEEPALFMDALKYRVTSFIKKPFTVPDVMDILSDAVRIKIADIFLKKETQKQEKELELLAEHKKYSNYQEELSFQKELQIIQNDFYYRLSNQEISGTLYLSDFLYHPLDIISGDSYSARQLQDGKELYFIVDGMGKGVSASVSAMFLTEQLNYLIDKSVKSKVAFNLEEILKEAILYLQRSLLEEEVVSLSVVLIDSTGLSLQYASYSMPAILLMTKEGGIERLPSNNPPINKYMISVNIKTINLGHHSKLLMYSDGLNENPVKDENETYSKYIEDDFKSSMTREDLRQSIKQRLGTQEDDITFIFLHQLSLEEELASLTIEAKLASVEEANIWYENTIRHYFSNDETSIRNCLAFNELCMNAYEHGALGISNSQKHQLLENDEYFEYLLAAEQKQISSIDIHLYKIVNPNGTSYLLTHIQDQGTGFNTEILKNVFGLHKNFNGRGVSMSRDSSLGIYYNHKANGVYFLNQL